MPDIVAYWIRTRKDKTHYDYKCSNCGKKSRFYKSIFCPSCGFRMADYVEDAGEKS